jgi:transcriptional regulator GlxA family with amidase domain
MGLAQRLLREDAMTASEVARRVGYEGFASLSRAYRDYFGYPPSQERPQ